MADKATSVDVAARAGVSRSAVSRVFTPGASASPETVAKVRAAAEELGYRPNRLARSLLTGESRMIGLVVSYLDNHFYPGLVEGLSRALQDEGYHVLMFMGGAQDTDMEDVLSDLLDYQVAGLVLASVRMGSDLGKRCRSMGVPVVALNRSDGDGLAVVSDNFGGGKAAVAHLIAQGARRIGYIAGREEASTQQAREAGGTAALQEAGLAWAARTVGGFSIEGATQAAREMFDGANCPDAVFVANDYMAFAVMDLLRHEKGFRVPENVAVIGFDDVPTARFAAYQLTSVRQDTEQMIARTVDALLGRDIPATPVPVRLVRRKSCGAG